MIMRSGFQRWKKKKITERSSVSNVILWSSFCFSFRSYPINSDLLELSEQQAHVQMTKIHAKSLFLDEWDDSKDLERNSTRFFFILWMIFEQSKKLHFTLLKEIYMRCKYHLMHLLITSSWCRMSALLEQTQASNNIREKFPGLLTHKQITLIHPAVINHGAVMIGSNLPYLTLKNLPR